MTKSGVFVGLLPFFLFFSILPIFSTYFEFFHLFAFLPFDPPISGVQKWENWGPGGSFKVCRIECDEGLKFSREVPEFYVYDAIGVLT